MASNHDTLIVNTVAYAIELSSQTKSELGEMRFKASAIAAIDALTELGYGKTGPVYEERDRLVCALSKCFPAHLVDATDSSEGWSSVVIIELPTGQVSWHVSDAELPWFAHLNRLPNDWDGHDSATKYDRLSALTELGWRPPLTGEEIEALVQRVANTAGALAFIYPRSSDVNERWWLSVMTHIVKTSVAALPARFGVRMEGTTDET